MSLRGSFRALKDIHDIAHGDPAHLIQEFQNLHLIFIKIDLSVELVVNFSSTLLLSI